MKPRNRQIHELTKNLARVLIGVMEMRFVEDYGSLSDRVQALINGDSELIAKILLIRPDIREENLSKCLMLTQKLLKEIASIPSKGTRNSYKENDRKAELASFLAKLLEVRRNQSKFFANEGLENDYELSQFPKLYELYENYLYNDSAKDSLIFPIGNLISSKPIEFGDWHLRQLSETEMTNLVEVHDKNGIPLITYPEFIISLDFSEKWRDKIKKIVGIIRLVKKDKVYLTYAYRAFGFPFYPWQIIDVPEGTKTSKKTLYSASDVLKDETELRDIWNLFEGMKDNHHVVTALRRFNLAYEREKIEDSWVDYFIALESLFVTGSTSEVIHKLSNRIARALGGETLEEKKELNKSLMKKIDFKFF